MLANLTKARLLSRALENSGYYTVLSNIHRPKITTSSAPDAESKSDKETEGTAVKQAEAVISNLAGQFAAKVGVNDAGASGSAGKKGAIINEEDAAYYNEGLPVVSFRFTDEIKGQYPDVKQAWVQEQLRAIGWIVPK